MDAILSRLRDLDDGYEAEKAAFLMEVEAYEAAYGLTAWAMGEAPTPSPLRQLSSVEEEPTTSSRTSECLLGKEGEASVCCKT